MKVKLTSHNIRVRMNEEDWKEVEEYLNSRQELVKSSVYGSAIVEKVKSMKKNGGAM